MRSVWPPKGAMAEVTTLFKDTAGVILITTAQEAMQEHQEARAAVPMGHHRGTWPDLQVVMVSAIASTWSS